eukprot:6214703-Amphidinium_carterae.1
MGMGSESIWWPAAAQSWSHLKCRSTSVQNEAEICVWEEEEVFKIVRSPWVNLDVMLDMLSGSINPLMHEVVLS